MNSTASSITQHIKSRGFGATLLHAAKHVAYLFHIKAYIPAARYLKLRAVRSFYGPRFTENHGDLTFRLYLRASYGFYLSNLLRETRSPFDFLDIGANQGLYSILAAQNKNCRHVWSFEPVPSTYALLQKNVSLNHCNDKVQALNLAISKESGPSTIGISASHTGAASMDRVDEGAATQTIDCVDATGLAKLLKPQNPLVVKIDTEGHEPVVIEQLRKMAFWPQVEKLFFEVDTRWVNGGQLVEQLQQDGFKEVFRSSGATHYDVMLARASAQN
jgi:FkbM family methyltransferase